MKLAFKSAFVLLISCFCVLNSAQAHSDLHERIEEISTRIEQDPQNAKLLFQRGLLYEQHEDFSNAIRDFDLVKQTAPETEGLEFARARSYFGLNDFRKALTELHQIGLPESKNGRVLLWRGRALSKLKRNEEATASYRAAFSNIENASPDLYIEFANLISKGGIEYYPEAIAGLDQAIEKIGPVITLNLAALELEEKVGDNEAALERLNRMLEQTPNMATLLKRKGDILLELNRKGEAVRTFELALKSIESLPISRRHTEANRVLEQEIRARLK